MRLISRVPLALVLLTAACSYAQTEPVADDRFLSTHFSGSGNCATCHNGLGAMNANGSIVGMDADASPSLFEPHHELITQGDQVQVYESIMGDTDGNLTYTLLRAATFLKDNRLLPQGFDKATAPSDVRVAGSAASDANFTGGSDTLTYQVPVSASGNLTVTAELLYQSMAYGFVQDLSSDAADPYVSRFLGYYDQATLRSERIASVSVVVP